MFNEFRLTYGQLNGQANQLARVLADAGVGPGSIAGVVAARAPHALVAILAVLKSGAAYLPLDPEYPRDRLTFLLEDARPATILGTALELEQLGVEWPAVCLDDAATITAAAWHQDTEPHRCSAPAAAARQRPGLPHLHLRFHRPAQGRARLAPGHPAAGVEPGRPVRASRRDHGYFSSRR